MAGADTPFTRPDELARKLRSDAEKAIERTRALIHESRELAERFERAVADAETDTPTMNDLR